MTPRYSTPAEEAAAGILKKDLEAEFGARPEDIFVVRSPFRVCPLGAHVDHQLGQVSGMALDRSVLLACAPARTGQVRLVSREFPGRVAFDLEDVPPYEAGCWGNYARGAALALEQGHPLSRGIDGIVRGFLPVGGVSSSSAVGVAYLLALEKANGLEVSVEENISLDRFIENRYIGLANGILDQSVILLGRRDRLLHLDCGTGAHRLCTFRGDVERLRILVVHSGMERSLISTDYNKHVDECREAAAMLLEAAGEPAGERPLLGHVRPEIHAAHAGVLPEHLARRARHFFSETARVAEGVKAWEDGDLERFGALMNASCLSSIHDYRCGCPELIALFEILSPLDGVHGARFSGAGYGGCCIALVDAEQEARISSIVKQEYLARFPARQESFGLFCCRAADGACVV